MDAVRGVSIEIRRGAQQDLGAVVRIHSRAFRGFYLTTLGPRFLQELYRGFAESQEGALLVCEVDGEVAGFVAGAFAPEEFFRTLLWRRWHAFGVAATRAVLQSPGSVVPRLLSALWYRGDAPAALARAALLSSIAVDPERTRLGVGARLLTAYCEEATRRNLHHVYLTTDREGNEAVNRFYRRHGFAPDAEIRRRNGRVLVRYVRALV